MKLWALAFGAASLAAGAPASHAADVGVSVHISQPGVYGRIDIGRFPQPQVVVAQPVVVVPPPVVVAQPVQPVYLWVPYDHRKHWRRYCHQYGACGVPVYFVRHDWYRDHVMVAGHGEHRGKGKRHRRGHDDD